MVVFKSIIMFLYTDEIEAYLENAVCCARVWEACFHCIFLFSYFLLYFAFNKLSHSIHCVYVFLFMSITEREKNPQNVFYFSQIGLI